MRSFAGLLRTTATALIHDHTFKSTAFRPAQLTSRLNKRAQAAF